ncbi:MAG: hypothetical protein JWO13_2371 [Acidobacteriales bacterium]|nr:hypothetical protein [Terriglobales bacterium]
MFLIDFKDEMALEYPFDDRTVPAGRGKLVLGHCEEEFLANLALWRKADYRFHWARELTALLGGKEKAALIVSYADPKFAANLEVWRVYRDAERAYFQNQILWCDELPKDFHPATIGDHIHPRRTIDSNGENLGVEGKPPGYCAILG